MKNFSLLIFCFAAQLCFSQADRQYLVKFTDKAHSPYSVNRPGEFLSAKAIERRARQHISVDMSDLPVNASYVNAVKALGVNTGKTSRWMNALSISTRDISKIEQIRQLTFVKEVILTADPNLPKTVPSKFDLEKVTAASSSAAPANDRVSGPLPYGQSYFQVHQLGTDCMHNSGFLGQGMTIAVLDAGFWKVDSLPAFDSMRTNNQILGCRDMVTGDTMVFEDYPHGMNVLSCMAGFLPGQLVGTAPKAHFWLIRTENAYSETLQEEVNWLHGAEFADSVGADIINSSLGYSKFDSGIGDHYYSDMDGNTTIVTNAADWAASKGIFVSSSAGNAGGPPWFKITAPADADSVLTVGAVDSAGAIAGFSSRGLTYDGRIKPNTCARGVQATVASDWGGVATTGGTSFSSPLTAGSVACLWQANPSATVIELIYAIQASATQAAAPDSIKGFGIPDFCKADSILGFVLSVNPVAPLSEDVSVFPNPFTEEFYISYYSIHQQTAQCELYDVTGRKVLFQEFHFSAGQKYTLRLPGTDGLSKGTYIMKITTASGVFDKKIIKQ
ncbi:MAG: S8/S53 family peptidase [Bacteroidia bacterium]